MKALLALILVPLLIAAELVWRGFVFSKLWVWFVVSSFGAPVLGLAQSIGLSMIVSFLAFRFTPKHKDQEDATAAMALFAVLAPAWVLFLGYIVHLCL